MNKVYETLSKENPKLLIEVLRKEEKVQKRFLELAESGYNLTKETLKIAEKKAGKYYTDELEFTNLDNALDRSYFHYDDDFDEIYLMEEEYEYWLAVDQAVSKIEEFKLRLNDEQLNELREYEENMDAWELYVVLSEQLEAGTFFA